MVKQSLVGEFVPAVPIYPLAGKHFRVQMRTITAYCQNLDDEVDITLEQLVENCLLWEALDGYADENKKFPAFGNKDNKNVPAATLGDLDEKDLPRDFKIHMAEAYLRGVGLNTDEARAEYAGVHQTLRHEFDHHVLVDPPGSEVDLGVRLGNLAKLFTSNHHSRGVTTASRLGHAQYASLGDIKDYLENYKDQSPLWGFASYTALLAAATCRHPEVSPTAQRMVEMIEVQSGKLSLSGSGSPVFSNPKDDPHQIACNRYVVDVVLGKSVYPVWTSLSANRSEARDFQSDVGKKQKTSEVSAFLNSRTGQMTSTLTKACGGDTKNASSKYPLVYALAEAFLVHVAVESDVETAIEFFSNVFLDLNVLSRIVGNLEDVFERAPLFGRTPCLEREFAENTLGIPDEYLKFVVDAGGAGASSVSASSPAASSRSRRPPGTKPAETAYDVLPICFTAKQALRVEPEFYISNPRNRLSAVPVTSRSDEVAEAARSDSTRVHHSNNYTSAIDSTVSLIDGFEFSKEGMLSLIKHGVDVPLVFFVANPMISHQMGAAGIFPGGGYLGYTGITEPSMRTGLDINGNEVCVYSTSHFISR